MDKNTFWQIIDDVNGEAGSEDYDGLLRATRERLMNYDPEEIADWFSHQRYYRDLADTGGVFAAACLLNDYMSSDGFNDFRMWLISRGRDVYMDALKNPDSLTDLKLRENTQAEMDSRWEAYGYVAIDAYKEILPHDDIYDMMERRPLSAAQKADIRLDIEYFPHKIGDQDAARQFMPKLCAKYIKPGENFAFSYSTDEDTAVNLLSDAPDSLRGITLRKLEDTKKIIQAQSKLLDIPVALRKELTATQNALAFTIDAAMNQIREYGSAQMNENNIEIDGELSPDGDRVTAYFSMWFNVDQRLGTQTEGTDAYVDLCANYYTDDDSLSVYYILHDTDGAEREPVSVPNLTDYECATILAKMKEAGLDECIAEMRGDTDESEGIQMG